jgi:hypothetical protein
MPSPLPVETSRKYYTVEEANKALSLVRPIVTDIVSQWKLVSDLKARLSAVTRRDVKKKAGDPYSEELAHSQAELESEEERLYAYCMELEALGLELKGPADGLCDFYSLKDGREIYLCWRLGEAAVTHWHELDAGFSGRQPIQATRGGRLR